MCFTKPPMRYVIVIQRHIGAYYWVNIDSPIHPQAFTLAIDWYRIINSLAPGRCGHNFRCLIFKPILGIDILSTCRQIDLSWIPQTPIGDKSTLDQVMVYGQRWSFQNFLQKILLAQFISHPEFTLFGWVSWPLFIFVFLPSISIGIFVEYFWTSQIVSRNGVYCPHFWAQLVE